MESLVLNQGVNMSVVDDLFTFEAGAMRCPHVVTSAARREGPVVWSDAAGGWVVTSHALACRVVRDARLFSSAASLGHHTEEVDEVSGYDEERASLVYADPPKHTRHRALVNGAFAPSQARRMEPLFEQLAAALCDQVPESGEIEFMAGWAMPFTTAVIADVLGLPRADVPDLIRWSLDIGVTVGGNPTAEELVAIQAARPAFDDYFTAAIEARRHTRTDDLLSDILYAEAEGLAPLSDLEVLGIAQQVVIGGVETTAHFLGTVLLRAATEPATWNALREDPAAIADVVEELLRIDGPAIGVFRTAMDDVELGGQQVRRGDLVYVSWSGANHDPDVFAEPEEVVPGRENGRRHLTFGHGAHFCVGAHVARTEARVALVALASRFEAVELADGDHVQFASSTIFHGPRSLRLRLRAA